MLYYIAVQQAWPTKCMLKSSHPLGQRIGVARLCYVDGCKDVLDTDQDGASLAPLRANRALPIVALICCD